MAAKYSLEDLKFDQLTTQGKWKSNGCYCCAVFNAGNINITINDVYVIEPLGIWEGPQGHPLVEQNFDLDIKFDLVNEPTLEAPIGGSAPPAVGTLKRDQRAIFISTFLKEK
jgi:hypothetical protein